MKAIEIDAGLRGELSEFVGHMALLEQAVGMRHAEFGLANHLKNNGRVFERRQTDTGHKRGRMGRCYDNSMRLALRKNSGLFYYEGYAYARGLIPLEHAWCADIDGNVLDVTWDEKTPTAYFGAKLFPEDLRELQEDRRFVVIPPLRLWLSWKADERDFKSWKQLKGEGK